VLNVLLLAILPTVRIGGLLALLFTPYWWIGLAGFVLLVVIRERVLPHGQTAPIRNDAARITLELATIPVAVWGLWICPWPLEFLRVAVTYGAIGALLFYVIGRFFVRRSV